MRELNIGVDLDGILYDFVGSLRRYLIEVEGFDAERLSGGGWDDWSEQSTWDFYRDSWGLSLDEYLQACDRGVDSGYVFRHGDPEAEGVETIEKIRSDGHKVFIITARSYGTKSKINTVEWLRQHGIQEDGLIITKHKTVIGVDLMVDDYEENFNDFSSIGTPCYLLTRPWNQHVDAGDLRINSWTEFYDRVRSEAAN